MERGRWPDEVKDEVGRLFNKKFHFHVGSDWALPPLKDLFLNAPFEDEELMLEKESLNRTKFKLDEKDINVWHQHTRRTNPTGIVIPKLRDCVSPEMCTNAWCKLHEILSREDYGLYDRFVSSNRDKFHSIHICEAPGAFICSLNHFIRTRHPNVRWEWGAVTLNPDYEGNHLQSLIGDNKLIHQTGDHWMWGSEDTGNVMSVRNQRQIIDLEKKKAGYVHVVTADGSIYCQDNPDEQEMTVSKLHYAEAVFALSILEKRGSLILKMFTLFEHPSVCLLYLLCCCFEDVYVEKPATSRAGNSETYVVAVKYKGLPDDYVEALQSHVDNFPMNMSMFPRNSLPPKYIREIRACALKFSRYQIDHIERNIRTFERMSPEMKKYFRDIRDCAAAYFIREMRVERLPASLHLVKDESTSTMLDGSQSRGERPSVVRRVSDRSEGGTLDERARKMTRFNKMKESKSSVHDSMKVSGGWEKVLRNMRYVDGKGLVEPVAISLVEQSTKTTEYSVCPVLELDDLDWQDVSCEVQMGLRVERVTNSPFFIKEKSLRNILEARSGSGLGKFGKENRGMLSALFPEYAVRNRLVGINHDMTVEEVLPRRLWQLAKLDSMIGVVPDDVSVEERRLRVADMGDDGPVCAAYLMARYDCRVISMGRLFSDTAPESSTRRWLREKTCVSDYVRTVGSDCAAWREIQERVEQIREVSDREGVDIYWADWGLKGIADMSRELYSKRPLVGHVIHALQVLRQGGTLVLRMHDMWTRFTLGVVYCICQYFRSCFVGKEGVGSSYKSERFVVLKDYWTEAPGDMIDFLRSVLDRLESLEENQDDSTDDVLGVVPMDTMRNNAKFFNYFVRRNENIADYEWNALVALENHG